MPKINLLSDRACRAASYTGGKETTYLDGAGLILVCTKAGGKRWRWWSRVGGKIASVALGAYPAMPLDAARRERDRLNQLKEAGINPTKAKREAKAKEELDKSSSFEVVAREWHRKKSPAWSASHREKVLGRLVANIFPALGERHLGQITPPELLAVIQVVEQNGPDLAHRLLQTCGQVFRHGVATGKCERDTAADLKGALTTVVKKHHAAIVNPKQLALVLVALWSYSGTPWVRAALRLTPMLAARPGELRHMEWEELDLDNALWSIPADKMKMKQPHLVPLARQTVAVLRELRPMTGHGRYVFPNPRAPRGDRPMSENAVRVALRTLGFDNDTATPHGFRATFRTIGAEVLEENPLVLEAQLAHRVPDALGTAYNRTSYLPQRKVFMQRWADYLDQLRGEGQN